MSDTGRWTKLSHWSPGMFILAAMFLFIGTAHSGLAFVIDSYAFNAWHGLVLELGRLAALLGTTGLSVEVAKRAPRLGALSRAVASLALVFVTALIALATLAAAGVLENPPATIGITAYVLSLSTFLLVGIGLVRTDTHSRRIGGLLLANVLVLLIVFFGRMIVPVGLVATVVPAIQVLLYATVGYSLKGRTATSRRMTPAPDTIS